MKPEIEIAAEQYSKEYYDSSDIKEPEDHFKAGVEWCFSRYGLPDEVIQKLTTTKLPDKCQSTEDGICRLPIGTCTQCNREQHIQEVPHEADSIIGRLQEQLQDAEEEIRELKYYIDNNR